MRGIIRGMGRGIDYLDSYIPNERSYPYSQLLERSGKGGS
jgi:hypothetical protein